MSPEAVVAPSVARCYRASSCIERVWRGRVARRHLLADRCIGDGIAANGLAGSRICYGKPPHSLTAVEEFTIEFPTTEAVPESFHEMLAGQRIQVH
jgi:hypothetical protein